MSPRAGLDRAAVVLAAADLVNKDGVDALSLNRLAERLKVQTPSLYNHIDGLPGLYRELRRLNAFRLSEQIRTAAIGKTGPEALRSIGWALRAYIKENPGLYLISLRAARVEIPVDAKLKEYEDQAVQVVVTVVTSFGLEGEDALHAVRGLRSLVHGFTSLEIAGGFGLPLDLDESFSRLLEMMIVGLQQAIDSVRALKG